MRGDRLTIWTRVRESFGSALIRLPSGVWVQYDVYYPQTVDPSNRYFFGPAGFSGGAAGAGISNVGPGAGGSVMPEAMGFLTPLRKYTGGRRYVVDQRLHDELVAAATTQQPSGYAAFLLPTSGGAGPVGDDLILGGYTATNPFGQIPVSTWGQLDTPNSAPYGQTDKGSGWTWGKLRQSRWGDFVSPVQTEGK